MKEKHKPLAWSTSQIYPKEKQKLMARSTPSEIFLQPMAGTSDGVDLKF
jgi:hypothetical protein